MPLWLICWSRKPQRGFFKQPQRLLATCRPRLAAHAVQVADADLVVSHVYPSPRCPWASFPEGAPYSHPPDAYGAAADAAAAEAREQRAAAIAERPWVPACAGAHLGRAPTACLQQEQLAALAETMAADWEGIEVRAGRRERGREKHNAVWRMLARSASAEAGRASCISER